MSRRLERLLQLDYLLRNSSGLTIAQMVKELEVSERTVFYDIAFLRDRYNAPLINEDGLYYYEDRSWKMPDADLTQGEIFSLLLGKQLLEQYLGTSFEKELRSAIHSLIRRLPKKVQVNLQELSNAYVFSAGAKARIDQFVVSEINRALLYKRQIKINYHSMHRNSTLTRIVDPYHIYDLRGNQYLIGFCNIRKDIRFFRLNRIKHIEVLMTPARFNEEFDLEAYLKQTFQIEIAGPPTEVEILFYPEAAKYVRERNWHHSQKLEEQADGSLILTMTVTGLGEIKRWVLTWERHAKVLRPQQLVDQIKEELQALNRLYS